MDRRAREAFGWLATCLTMYSFISPIIPFINVFKKKISYEDTPALMVTTMYINCLCWFVYGEMIYSTQIRKCNLIGAISSLLLIIIYLICEIRKYTLDAILNTLLIITGTYSIYQGFTLIIDDDGIIGKICILSSFIVFLFQIQIIYKVLKEKNYNLISIHFSCASLAANICWCIYGIFLTDINIIVPNFIGEILAIVQICIYLNYRNKYSNIGERDPSTSTIGIETNENDQDKKEDTSIKVDDEDKKFDVKEKPVKIVEKTDN